MAKHTKNDNKRCTDPLGHDAKYVLGSGNPIFCATCKAVLSKDGVWVRSPK